MFICKQESKPETSCKASNPPATCWH
jgi:hypothetical protein